jgi:hypothetical protein
LEVPIKASVSSGILRLELTGWSRWLALAGRLDIPLSAILRASAGPPGLPKFDWSDRRVGGTSIPGFFAMGRFRIGSPPRRAFLELRRSSTEVLALELRDYLYDLVMVEIDDLAGTLASLRQAGIGA